MSPIPGLDTRLSEDVLQPVACGMCGSSERRTKFQDGPFAVVTCRECGLTYVTPRLADDALLEAVYDEGYWSSPAAGLRGYATYRRDAELYLRTFRRRLPVIRRHFSRPGRVLDVGCAAGYFLQVMREEGWEVAGIEPSLAIRPQAEERIGKENVRGEGLEQAGFEPASFDLITLWDVIEHVPDFLGTLRAARRLLRPQGRLLVETQNVKSRVAELLGRKWQHYKHAEHLYHFEPRTLAEALRRSGFVTLENSPFRGGKYVAMDFIAERAGRLHPVWAAMLSPLRLFARRAVYVNLFDEMLVVARPA